MTAPSLDIHITADDLEKSLRDDAMRGLTASPKWLPPKYFYDAVGSELFERITELDEYYPTRTERALLAERASDIARVTDCEVLVELGSGSSDKTRLLLSAGLEHGSLTRYVPQDVSPSALTGAMEEISREYPGLDVHGVVSDFTDTLRTLPSGGRRTIAFLGGTLGNLVPEERADFLDDIARTLEAGEHLLLGVGLVIDPAIMVPAYDDAEGVTASFDLNVLSVLNGTLGATFDADDFEHVAVWDERNEWIEMRLRARRAHTVRVEALDLDVTFGEGEEMRTEISAKFRRESITGELAAAGLSVQEFWTDADSRFALILARR
ncbi:MAG: L-histidine N(alpha)-methyltransferase [Rhodococcus sp. (in: high G+C Gram-positive bacteria)]